MAHISSLVFKAFKQHDWLFYLKHIYQSYCLKKYS